MVAGILFTGVKFTRATQLLYCTALMLCALTLNEKNTIMYVYGPFIYLRLESWIIDIENIDSDLYKL